MDDVAGKARNSIKVNHKQTKNSPLLQRTELFTLLLAGGEFSFKNTS